MSVQRAQQEISSVEFAEWLAFQRTNPSGEERADIRNALLCYVVASVVGGKGHKLEDFIIDFERESQSKEQIVANKLKAFADQHNAQVKQQQEIKRIKLAGV